jgi:hypothetical protein
MSKKRAFIRYTKAGNIVPGSLILTNGSYPNGPGLWKEITTDLCCENNNTMNYKVYTALLTQTGTDDPVATVLENTLGFDITWYRDNVGFYLFQNDTTGVLFDPDKTWINTPADHTYDNNTTPGVYRGSETPVPYLGIITPDDGYLVQYSIEIRVYP